MFKYIKYVLRWELVRLANKLTNEPGLVARRISYKNFKKGG